MAKIRKITLRARGDRVVVTCYLGAAHGRLRIGAQTQVSRKDLRALADAPDIDAALGFKSTR